MVQAGQLISAEAETLAIPHRSIVNWVARAEQQAAPAAAAVGKPSYEDLEVELWALRAKVAQLTEGNALLRNVSASVAQHAQTRRS